MDTDLNADFGQVDLHGQLLAAVDVRVVRLFKGPFQFVQLERGERGAVPPVFLAVVVVVVVMVAEVVVRACADVQVVIVAVLAADVHQEVVVGAGGRRRRAGSRVTPEVVQGVELLQVNAVVAVVVTQLALQTVTDSRSRTILVI